jgi:outer membrane protein assembly factor BamB
LATPLIFDFNGKRIAAISARGTVYGVDVKTGKVQWSHEWQSDADPTLIDSQLYLIGGGRGTGSALLQLKDGGPEVVWENGDMSGVFQTGVVVDGYAYGYGRDRREQPLHCVDIRSGEVKWRQDLGDWGALIAADGKLIILDGDGDLIIAETSPQGYKEISRAKVFDLKHWQSYQDGQPNSCWTAPVLANGKIFARSTWGELVCVQVG